MKVLPILLPYVSLWLARASALPTLATIDTSRNISTTLFNSLEELARLVDISYCVGSTGILKPFQCISRCQEFPGFELVSTWNTGPLLSDSCGYIALSHPPFPKRIIVAFRGTYSIANTVIDLSTVPQEYAPFPEDGGDSHDYCAHSNDDDQTPISEKIIHQMGGRPKRSPGPDSFDKCTNCSVHAGFMTSWKNTRCTIISHIESALSTHPDYQLTLVGHSLGGAVAALASLEFMARGWNPQVTTFGEPRIGNRALMEYIDARFDMSDDKQAAKEGTYRRVTHVNDPVPLLPLREWGYDMHRGEIYISKLDLSPQVGDLEHCAGDEDPRCIAGADLPSIPQDINGTTTTTDKAELWYNPQSVPARYRLWELFFAHRDYFWRLGLCVPHGDPHDWWREYPHNGEEL